MQAKIIQYLIPIICVVLLAFAAAAGGSAWGWNRGVAAEQAKLAKERANMAQREKDIATAEAKWQGMVQVESTKFAQTAMELAAARVLIDQLGENDRVEIRKVATDRQCVSPATARVLNASIAKANARLAATRDPGVLVAAATATAPVAAPDAGEQHVALPSGYTEREVAEYINELTIDYSIGADRHNRLVDTLRASPLIKVVPDKRSL